MSSHHPTSQPNPASIEEQAALWLARRDRGLTAAEQDDYLQWLREDPRHTEVIVQQAAALERMMHLSEWQPAHTAEPNPDLFATVAGKTQGHRPWWRWPAGLAAAAALTIGYFSWRQVPAAPAVAKPGSHLRVNERLALPDGSRVELKDGSNVVVRYSEAERRVRLTGGMAHFSVWKDATRPFVVEAGGVELRALGTAFNVRLEKRAVEVIVTEGRVKVEMNPGIPGRKPEAAGTPNPAVDAPFSAVVAVGQRIVVPLAAVEQVPVVANLTPEEISEALAWQAPRLQFYETPLAEAVAEFNRLNRHQLVLGDRELDSLRIGGTFRPDNVEGFVRLLDTTLGVRGEKAGEDRTVLRRGR